VCVYGVHMLPGLHQIKLKLKVIVKVIFEKVVVQLL
jgi:hypothetical protein